eukprot:7091524-Pyramimonas_sp.AAC.2
MPGCEFAAEGAGGGLTVRKTTRPSSETVGAVAELRAVGADGVDAGEPCSQQADRPQERVARVRH